MKNILHTSNSLFVLYASYVTLLQGFCVETWHNTLRNHGRVSQYCFGVVDLNKYILSTANRIPRKSWGKRSELICSAARHPVVRKVCVSGVMQRTAVVSAGTESGWRTTEEGGGGSGGVILVSVIGWDFSEGKLWLPGPSVWNMKTSDTSAGILMHVLTHTQSHV